AGTLNSGRSCLHRGVLVNQAGEHAVGSRVTVLDEHTGDLVLTGPDVTHHAFNRMRCMFVVLSLAMLMFMFLYAFQVMIVITRVVMVMTMILVVSMVPMHTPHTCQIGQYQTVGNLMGRFEDSGNGIWMFIMYMSITT